MPSSASAIPGGMEGLTLSDYNSDYRKLTFFYDAEEYINFNELVTDLFKVYKTRIRMSAISPSTYMAMNPNTAPRPSQFRGFRGWMRRSNVSFRTRASKGEFFGSVSLCAVMIKVFF
ncbi:hypothetical protein EJ08DRAFT_709867 [Tothia fuscella]|uniref:PSP1 C-terminal domain-containing protein n=1 Tax=Tothia fuscella TaxID=1048955 RepID=A0A9P4NVQ1_9PEZI|nr:hypothetical protein EJ08DRAFT_709867 [Tothia fuscella]